MDKTITYKTKLGSVTQTVEYNQVGLPNLLQTTIYCGDITPKTNETVFLTSCEIPYHNDITDNWVNRPNNDDIFADVILELISYDDSNYEPSKCHNGGKYLESEWIIKEIKNISTFKEMY